MKSHQLVLNWIDDELQTGRLALGQRLPGERALAQQLSVSRNSVREAIRILEAMGVVRSAVGSGPDAGTLVTADPTTALASAIKLHMSTSHLQVKDIVQTRVALETWAAAHADAKSKGFEEAEALLAAMDAKDLGAAEFLTLDARFHVAVSSAAGNVLISAMMFSLRESIQRYAGELTSNLPDWELTCNRLRSEHHGIIAAIRRGDSVGASDLIRDHIENYYREAGLGGPDTSSAP